MGRGLIKCVANFSLRLALLCGNSLQNRDQSAIRQVRSRCDIDDAVHDDWPHPAKKALFVVTVESTRRKTTTGAQSAKGIGDVGGNSRQIVERKDVRIVGRNSEVAHVSRQPAQGG